MTGIQKIFAERRISQELEKKASLLSENNEETHKYEVAWTLFLIGIPITLLSLFLRIYLMATLTAMFSLFMAHLGNLRWSKALTKDKDE